MTALAFPHRFDYLESKDRARAVAAHLEFMGPGAYVEIESDSPNASRNCGTLVGVGLEMAVQVREDGTALKTELSHITCVSPTSPPESASHLLLAALARRLVHLQDTLHKAYGENRRTKEAAQYRRDLKQQVEMAEEALHRAVHGTYAF